MIEALIGPVTGLLDRLEVEIGKLDAQVTVEQNNKE